MDAIIGEGDPGCNMMGGECIEYHSQNDKLCANVYQLCEVELVRGHTVHLRDQLIDTDQELFTHHCENHVPE